MLAYFLLLSILFPLTMPPENALMHTIAPGLLWIALLFSIILSTERMFQQDHDDGVLEQWFLSGHPISMFVIIKILTYWLLTIIPITIFLPIFALLFNLSLQEISILALSVISGTPSIMALCALSAAFSTGIKQKSIFMALIVLPLTLPILIFGSIMGGYAMQIQTASAYLALLLACSCATLSCIPFAIAGILRIVI